MKFKMKNCVSSFLLFFLLPALFFAPLYADASTLVISSSDSADPAAFPAKLSGSSVVLSANPLSSPYISASSLSPSFSSSSSLTLSHSSAGSPSLSHSSAGSLTLSHSSASSLSPSLSSASFLYSSSLSTSSADTLNLYAASAALIDASSGRLLYGKDPYNEMPMASTTKIMTCILALEYGDPDEIVTVSAYAASMPDVQLNIREGEQYYLGDLLYAMMLESYNDVAVAIAEHIGGDVEGFAELMNAKAERIGLFHTHFVTPNGLDADGHYTTAYDLAILGAYAIANEDFLAITNTSSWSFSTVDGARSFTASNKDAFLTQMDGAIGIKTGFTSKAGYCFVGALRDGNRTFVSVVLASGWPPNKSYKWSDTRKLMEYGLANYSYRCIFTPIDHFATLTVTDGLSDTVDTWIDGSLTLLMREDETVNVIYDYEDTLAAPVEAGEIVGYAYVTLDNSLVEAYPIRAAASVGEKDFAYYLNYVISSFTASFF